jgi:hypothetical protein
MSGIDQPIFLFGTEDPEYYAELFCKTSRLGLAHRRIQSNELFHPDVRVLGIQGVDHPLSRRLQTLLDSVADISLCKRGNVSATTAYLKDDKGTLETRLYIVFNHKDDDEVVVVQHLQDIFKMLHQVPYKSMDSSPKVIANDLQNDYIKVCRAIHNYSFDIFAYRVTKREHKLPDIRRYIELDQTYFTPQDRSTLVRFLDSVSAIIKKVADAQTTKQLSTHSIKLLLNIYLYWTEHGLLLKDSPADGKPVKVTLLDRADAWLAQEGA